MFELTGKHATAKVFANDVEETAMSQLHNLLNCELFESSNIRIMPDVHAGAGCVIGFTCVLGKPIMIPNLVGVDIGCGVAMHKLLVPIEDLDTFDKSIHSKIPSGFNIHEKAVPLFRTEFTCKLEEACKIINYDYDKAVRSLGTLGGGNHFLELGVSTEGDQYLTVHSGSRNFGKCVCDFWQTAALARWGKRGGLEHLEGTERDNYLLCAQAAQEFAQLNRQIILGTLTGVVGRPDIESVHNYVSMEEGCGVIRKGAISAKFNEKVVIPWNMRDGLIIGLGKGNKDWNNSAPHGAGRKLGRGAAKRTLEMDDFFKSMEGIYSSCVSAGTLDESPMAYKDATEIESQLGDTVEIVTRVKPILNFKAGEK